MNSQEKLPSLYHLTLELAALLDRDDAEPGDLEAQVDLLLPAIKQKAAGVAAWIEYQEDLAGAIKERERKVAEARKAIEARVERWRTYLQNCMDQANIDTVTDDHTGRTIRLQGNPPHLSIDDEAALPAKYLRTPPPPPPVPDKKAIGVALKAGDVVRGCRLVLSRRLVIR